MFGREPSPQLMNPFLDSHIFSAAFENTLQEPNTQLSTAVTQLNVMCLFPWSTFQPKLWYQCQELSYVNPQVDYVSTCCYITSQCSLWPHIEHNLNSMSWQNNTEQLTPTLCLSLLPPSISLLHTFAFWLCKLFTLVQDQKWSQNSLKCTTTGAGDSNCSHNTTQTVMVWSLHLWAEVAIGAH